MLSKKESDSEVYMDVNGWVLKPQGLNYTTLGYLLRFERKFGNEDDEI